MFGERQMREKSSFKLILTNKMSLFIFFLDADGDAGNYQSLFG
jgi:hypothetical protein